MNRRQTIPKHLRFTIQDFNERFPDDTACLAALMEMRFPGGISYCEKCEMERKHYRIAGRPVFSCAYCGTQVSPMAGTIFEKSTTSLRLWFYAMYLMASTRCGISAKQIQRETGVTYKTAWRMFRQIRWLLSEPEIQLDGEAVEVDETYMGGKRKGGAGRYNRRDKGNLIFNDVLRQVSELADLPARRNRLSNARSSRGRILAATSGDGFKSCLTG
jgi:transposase-like protein